MDLTRDELKDVMRDILQELLWEVEQGLPDPDAGLDVRPEVAEYLLGVRQSKHITHSYDDAMRALGLDE